MVKTLKQKGLLDIDFPRSGSNREQCNKLEFMLRALENQIYEKFDAENSIKADCVKRKLKEKSLLNYLMKNEVVEMSKDLQPEKIKEMLDENRKVMKNILNEVAEECESDKTWAGIFDDILGNTNSSLPVLEQNYCVLSYLLDNQIIEIENIDRNPENIDTSNLDCDVIMNNYLHELQIESKQKYETVIKDEEKLQCVNDKLSKENIIIILALNEIEKLDISPKYIRKNKEKLEETLKNFLEEIFSCVFGFIY